MVFVASHRRGGVSYVDASIMNAPLTLAKLIRISSTRKKHSHTFRLITCPVLVSGDLHSKKVDSI